MFYDKFKQLCFQKGVSCNKAAAEIGLSNATPTSWKKRGLTPKGDTLTKIADYFEVTTDYLLSDETSSPDEKNNPLANTIFNASRVTALTPNENAVIADIAYDSLVSKKAPTQTDGREDITFDDFTYAMQNETKDLTDADKNILLSMARQLNDARKQRNGEHK